ncbi:hypothetical protein IWQ62_001887 [Dispira parvispora]|uniref:Phosducin domain-containing protein n=1 Tax=Dispira parvispora TaxID=1520584 RepID=A0A9W8E7R0_9FUNG|nr:hypothetical protein IWQ62_001887 [Dispira parvispora]
MGDYLEQQLLKSLADPDETPKERQRAIANESDTVASDDESSPSDHGGNSSDGLGRTGLPPGPHQGPQTGPKGVLSEYRHHRLQQRAERQLKEAQWMEKLGGTYRRQAPRGETDASTVNAQGEPKRSDQAESDDEDLDELLDDDVLERYRQQRMAQWHTRQAQQTPRFGTVEEITEAEYVDVIEKVSHAVPVIVHVYEPVVPACRYINQILDHLASTFVHCRFVRIRASATGQSKFTPDVLPIIIGYRDGVLIDTIVRVSDYVPEAFTQDDFVSLLQEHRLLPIGSH